MQNKKFGLYFTKQNIAQLCLKEILKKIPNLYKYYLIEPSAGNGDFYNILETKNKIGIDIIIKNENFILHDFLLFDEKEFFKKNNINQKIITIGNPPFGRNSNLALKFLNKSSIFSEYVCFILPKTFKKINFQNKIYKKMHLIHEIDIPNNSFYYENNIFNIPCCFQIWKKEKHSRKFTAQKLKTNDFNFTTKENADFAIRRIGNLAGKIILEFNNYSKSSHYYIKTNIDKNIVINKINSIDWKNVKYNTAGNPSIGKAELINLYEKL